MSNSTSESVRRLLVTCRAPVGGAAVAAAMGATEANAEGGERGPSSRLAGAAPAAGEGNSSVRASAWGAPVRTCAAGLLLPGPAVCSRTI